MHRFLCTGLFAILVVSGFSQSNPEPYGTTISKTDLQKHLNIIAGAEMEGRETGTEGQRKAAVYIADQFKQIGLLPAPGTSNYQQFFGVGFDSVLTSQFIVNGKFLDLGKDYVNETSVNNNGNIKAAGLVFVGYGISDAKYNDYDGKKVKGKVVVFVNGEPKKDGAYLISGDNNISSWTRPGGIAQKARLAKEKGAVAAIIINTSMDTISGSYAKLSKKSSLRVIKNTSNAVNCVVIPKNQARSLLGIAFTDGIVAKATSNQLLNKEKLDKKISIQYNYSEQKISTDASNVVGYIEGTDKKDEFVVLTGHYDHLGKRGDKIYYGADDDGSGTCAVLVMAETFIKAKAAGNGPRRSIVFMTVSGEEKGLWGSEYYSDSPLFPLEKTTVDLNTDMVGRIDPKRTVGDSMNYVYVIGDDKISSDLKPISESINQKYTNLELDYKYNDPSDPERIYYRSDHYNFARKGVPIIFYFNGTHKDYHKETDTVEKINWDLYEKRVKLIFYTAWEIANRDAMLKRDIPLN
jgi:Zn-dependent M28 family amino/carboxypeptidase